MSSGVPNVCVCVRYLHAPSNCCCSQFIYIQLLQNVLDGRKMANVP